MKKLKKVLVIFLGVSFVASLSCGCAKTEVAKISEQGEAKSEEPKALIRRGILAFMNSSVSSDLDAKAVADGFSLQYYDDFNSMVLALKSDKIESIYRLPEVVARYIENNVEGVTAAEPTILSGSIELSLGVLKEKTEIYNLFNDAMDKLLNNGTIDRLNEEYLNKYLTTKKEPQPVDLPKIEGAKTFKIAVTGDMPPIDFVSSDGRPAGFNVVLLSEISKIANVNIELVQVNSAARLTALKTNAVDAIFYAYQGKPDNEKVVNLRRSDLPEEIVITKPYYTSRIYEVSFIKK